MIKARQESERAKREKQTNLGFLSKMTTEEAINILNLKPE
jgi:hypothetical protein